MQHPDVFGVHVNPLAASVVIECRDGFELGGRNPRFPGLEVLAAEPHALTPFVGGHDRSKPDPADTLGFVELIIKLIVALTTKQLGGQLIEWVVAAVVQAARHEADVVAARRQAPGRPQVLLLASAE
jgi:hypothetical protein